MRISIVSLPVRDQQVSKAFYRDQLGFSVTAENPMGPDMTWITMRPPQGETSITLVNWFDSMPPGTQQGLVLECADIEKSRQVLLASEVEVSAVEDGGWGLWAAFSDPDGNGWVLTEVKPSPA